MITETITIYTLSGPDDVVFYVGCTKQGVEVRLGAHISEAKYYMNGKPGRKSKKIIDFGFQITATVIDVHTLTEQESWIIKEKVKEIEKVWIYKYIDMGFKLVNREAMVSSKKEYTPDFVGKKVQSNEAFLNTTTHA